MQWKRSAATEAPIMIKPKPIRQHNYYYSRLHNSKVIILAVDSILTCLPYNAQSNSILRCTFEPISSETTGAHTSKTVTLAISRQDLAIDASLGVCTIILSVIQEVGSEVRPRVAFVSSCCVELVYASQVSEFTCFFIAQHMERSINRIDRPLMCVGDGIKLSDLQPVVSSRTCFLLRY